MKILGIDTTAKVSTAALMCDGNIIAELDLSAGFTHSQTILPIINSILDLSNTTINDIDLFAVTTGPGSFTGVRTGVSLVKGLAFPRNIGCIGLSSLEALAYNLYGLDGFICPVMDARRSQVYTALFEFSDGIMKRCTDDDIMKIDELGEKIKNISKPLFFVGDGATLCYNNLGNMNDNFVLAPLALRHQKGASVCRLANHLVETNKNCIVDCETIMPSYLRPSQAERELKARNSKI